MNNQKLLLIILVFVVIAGGVYYQKHTHTASINLPGGKDISVTTHDEY
ncbi:MAG: hypothetical protein ACOYNL_03420 [Rickettsiales bacterium]